MLQHNIPWARCRYGEACASDQSLHVAAQQYVALRDYQFSPGEPSNLQIRLTPVTETPALPRKHFVYKSVQRIPPSSVARSADTKYPVACLHSGRVMPRALL